MRRLLVKSSLPAKIRTVPASGLKMSSIKRIVVVLPAPFGPSKPKISPGSTANETSATACMSPKHLARCDTSTVCI